MTNSTIDNLLNSCDRLQRYTLPGEPGEGLMHSSVKCFNACMRAFDRKGLTPESITFRVYFKAPVNAYGFAAIHRDGTMEMRTSETV